MTVKIQEAKKSDLKAIKNLISLYPEKLLQTHLPKWQEFFVAKNNFGEIVGCCALEEYSRRLSEIRSLVVEPKYQKQGVAKKLIQACLKRAKKRKVFELLTITGAMGLFQKYGFQTFNQEKFALLKILTKK